MVPTYIDPGLLSDCKGWILSQPVVVGASGAGKSGFVEMFDNHDYTINLDDLSDKAM